MFFGALFCPLLATSEISPSCQSVTRQLRAPTVKTSKSAVKYTPVLPSRVDPVNPVVLFSNIYK